MSVKSKFLASQWMKAASIAVLLFALAISFLLYQLSLQNLEARTTRRFQKDAKELVDLAERRIELYVNFLYSAKGLFSASEYIDRAEWAAFIHANDLKSRYPGIQALRYIEKVPSAEKENFITKVEADKSLIPAGYPGFKILPEREASEYYVIKYVQPYIGNELMLGYDLSSEPARNASMKAAADLDEPRATAVVTLLNDTDRGIVIFMPVYHKGGAADDVESRRAALLGFVDTVIIVKELFKNIDRGGKFEKGFQYKIYDGVEPSEDNLIYASEERELEEGSNRSFTLQAEIAGRVWTFLFSSKAERWATPTELLFPKIILAGGIVMGFLLAGLMYAFSRTNARALEIAGRMTEGMNREMEERRKADERLKQLFHQLEIKSQQAHLTRSMADLLQSSSRIQEAFSILASFAEKIFPLTRGELYLINASRNFLEAAAGWGGFTVRDPVILMDACWALRRGRIHYASEESSQPLCDHVKESGEVLKAICVPLMIQGEALGVFHLQFDEAAPQEELLLTFCDQASLALGNLKLRETLRNQSIRDPLTGIFNRRFMEETLTREISRCARMAEPLSIFMFDVDHFKKCNDQYGHEMGDSILSSIGQFITKKLRRYDTPCRYGGEEFLVIMPGASMGHAFEKAEQLRREISELKMGSSLGTQIAITLSFGVAAYPLHGDSMEELVRAADQALYAAKTAGRNRVICAADFERERQNPLMPEK